MLLLDPTPGIIESAQAIKAIQELGTPSDGKIKRPSNYIELRRVAIIQGLRIIACQLLPHITHSGEWEPMLPPRRTRPATSMEAEAYIQNKLRGVMDHPFWFKRVEGTRQPEDYILVTFPYDRESRPVGSRTRVKGLQKKVAAVHGDAFSVLRVDDGWGIWNPRDITAVYIIGSTVDPYED